jgi:hypothetical protein
MVFWIFGLRHHPIMASRRDDRGEQAERCEEFVLLLTGA